MFFQRYQSYMLAIDYAKQHGFEYDWFVMLRPDTAWGAPIESIEEWPADRIYVPDRWTDIIPDTFALMPAALAEPYFSMEVRVSEGVMCLGGPDFLAATIEPSTLEKRGLDTDQIDQIQSLKCNGEGHSEVILANALQKHGVKVGQGRFFLMIVRDYQPAEECWRLSPMSQWRLNGIPDTATRIAIAERYPTIIPSVAFQAGCAAMLHPAVCHLSLEFATSLTASEAAVERPLTEFHCPRRDDR
jgi:hypothetical protein